LRLKWKIVRLTICGSALLLVAAGCSGINTGASVSPASFFLPGLLQADPPAAHPDLILPTLEPRTEAAQT
jgi:hypothetical protein